MASQSGNKEKDHFATGTKDQVGDVDINFVRVGTGDHSVLFLPGLLGTAWLNFGPHIESLGTEKLTIVAWDPPGYGKSRPPDRTFPDNFYQRDATWTYSLMKTLGYSKFSLIGMVDGSITALWLAATYPESIHKMIVFGARSYIHPAEVKVYECMTTIDTFPEFLRTRMMHIYDLNYIEQTTSKWLNAMRRLYNKQNGDLCNQALPKIKCPTFILCKSVDRLLAPDHPFYLKQNITNSMIYVYEAGTPTDFTIHPKQFKMVITEILFQK
ncbi:valacyclovir hydrolase [Ooceraea biroi]|uniref:valacyclovir hydrolase n=1 Tax=Ooceraea biroi TaxID=2015173 RepID=UPI000F07E4C5|nr:valacyclovir hydrolase [Ooceraea biroi]